MKRRLILIWPLLVLAVLGLQAQKPKVQARIGSMEILIGEHVPVTVSVEAKTGANVHFPDVATLPAELEFLGKIDNKDEKLPNGRLRQSRSYVFTSFVDSLYEIPPFIVTIDGEDYETNPIPLKVVTIDVDTTFVDQFNGPKYYGPHDVQDVEFNWFIDGWGKGLLLACLLPLLVVAIVYLSLRLSSNKPIIARIRIIRHELPHLKAMKSIERIKADKMVTAEDPKEYYTQLTDTLRQYINERYGFNAMEMTSSEIIDRLMQTDDPKALEELRQLFLTADLVKFAKYSTMINENDANLVSAIDFINQTKLENMPTEEVVKPELTREQQQTNKSRRVLIALIAVLSIATALLLAYIIYYLQDLL